MFPVRYTPEFNDAHLDITRRLYFQANDPSVLERFDDALDATLENVRTFPEAYPHTPKGRRRFAFAFRSIRYTVFYTFDGSYVVLHDIRHARSAQVAHWLIE